MSIGSLGREELLRLVKAGQRAERTRAARKGCIEAMVTAAIADLLSAWLFMLTVGIAHHDWLPGLPTIGWWTSLLVWVVMPALPARSKSKKDGAP